MNNPNKLKMHSPNLTQGNLARIRELFPNCVTEASSENGKVKLAVDFDLLRQELSEAIVEGPQERYQLNWPGKREALLTANAPIAKTLRPCRDESVDFDITKNLYIEGDNLDALKLLQETYLGKVKMIYIDPPYNTGNDFIYKDDFAENTDEFLRRSNQKDEEGNRLVANTESNGRFHSDWLSMMYPRLKLAKNLLRDDGVLFISCDDNEASNLKLICDSIFGSSAFIASVSIVNNLKGRNDKKVIATAHETLLIYANSFFISKGIPLSDEKVEEFNLIDEHGEKYLLRDLRKRGGNDNRSDRPNLFFPLYYNKNLETISLERRTADDIEILPRKSDGTDGCWRWGKERVAYFIKHIHPKQSSKTGYWGAEYRVYLNSKFNQYAISSDEDDCDFERSTKPKSVWFGGEHSTDIAKKELKKLFPKNDFDYPKSTQSIKTMVRMGSADSDIILDFFSGSATTAHAVMQLNAEDGGSRQFIMMQLPEPCDEKSEAHKAGYKTIAEIGKERIRRAGAKIKAELNAQQSPNSQGSLLDANAQRSSPLDIGFRVLKVDSSNMSDVYYTPDTLNQNMLDMITDNIKPGRTPEDLLFQVLLDWGVDLTLPIHKEIILGKTVFFVDENALVACFDTGLTEELIKELARAKPLRVVFRDNGFSSDAVKINATQIFRQMSPGTEVKAI